MRISKRLSAADVILDLSVASKKTLLETLAAAAAQRLDQPAEEILGSLEAREQLGSTALRNGVALPHALLERGTSELTLFARLRRPVYFDPSDDEPVDLVFVMLWPAADPKGFLSSMAELCRALRAPQLLRALRQAAHSDEVLRLLDQEVPPDDAATGRP
jgi:PTS system nitrogen regulatory IIA component